MSTRTIGILASVIGSAFGTWWMIKYRRSRTASAAASSRGTIIFDNTPVAVDADAIL